MYNVVLAFITAFGLTYLSIPSIIHVARVKKLCDMPGERRSHTDATPSLGGIAIFAGILFSIVLWTPFEQFGNLQYILCALLIMFLIGAKDDILPISPKKKLLGQILATAIITFKAEIFFSSLHGIFGVYEIPQMVGIPLSIFTMVVIINAFNLIDGINGLAASITSLVGCTLGIWFFSVDRVELAILAFALVGSSLAFLKYNITPAKIFMGDTGSLLLGLMCSILIIEFIEFNQILAITHPYKIASGPAVAIGILVLPLFDTLRVFTTRLLKGKSPFYPDRTHIHHLLLDSGFSHMQSTTILVIVNVLFIFLVYTLQGIGTLNLLVSIFAIASFLSAGLYMNANKRNKEKAAIQAASAAPTPEILVTEHIAEKELESQGS